MLTPFAQYRAPLKECLSCFNHRVPFPCSLVKHLQIHVSVLIDGVPWLAQSWILAISSKSGASHTNCWRTTKNIVWQILHLHDLFLSWQFVECCKLGNLVSHGPLVQILLIVLLLEPLMLIPLLPMMSCCYLTWVAHSRVHPPSWTAENGNTGQTTSPKPMRCSWALRIF